MEALADAMPMEAPAQQPQQERQPPQPEPQPPQEPQHQPPQEQPPQSFPSSSYDAPTSAAASQQQQQQQQQQVQQSIYNPQQVPQQLNAYSLKAPPAMAFGAASASVEERATHLLAACESCLVVTRVPGVDMSFRRIMERKCPRCGGTLVLPQEVMEMLILYGNFVSESVAVTLVLGTMVLHPSLRADFMAAAMNELLIPLQTDFVYDVAVPKRPEGLGMSLRMNREWRCSWPDG
ncbi:unnamed protein product [Phytophthora fragariaefolia]|uniref:Unnamed protein product n=1 Tax=Phytophthora fragariaefolia TaxID=1490495 RepID=A0A9W6Y191_9STRA|nr:unnamed protein product [Phytophthora fragariaefolia]